MANYNQISQSLKNEFYSISHSDLSDIEKKEKLLKVLKKYEKITVNPDNQYYKDEDKKELIVNKYEYKGKNYIILKDNKNKVIKRFKYDEKATQIKNLSKTKYANEKTIKDYYRLQSDEKYIPTSKKEGKENLKQLIKNDEQDIKYHKDIKVFQNENRLIFTNKKQIKSFDYMYMNVTVKIYFDGFYTIVNGRSDYIYRQILENEKMRLIQQAIKRAIAPYGSNVKFKLIEFKYVYHQQNYLHFNKDK